MANTIKIKRKIGGAQSAPAGANNAGELSVWKAGSAPADALAVYFNDGTQWVNILDTGANLTLAKPGAGAAGRVPTADASGSVSWATQATVSVRGVTAGADQGSVQATFNNDAITVAAGQVVIYTYQGSAYVYTGGTGSPVLGATSAQFTVLGSTVNVDTQFVDLGTTATDIGAGWTALGTKPATTGAVVTVAAFKGDTYILVNESAPATVASWLKVGSTPTAATASEIISRTSTTTVVTPAGLAGAVTAAPTGTAADAGKLLALDASGKLGANALPATAVQTTSFIDATTGVADAGKPIKTNATGLVGDTFLANAVLKSETIAASVGAGSAGQVPKTDAAGKIDATFLPAAVVLETELLGTSTGATDAGKPIKLNAAGKIDLSMLDVGGINYAGSLDLTAAYAAPTPTPADGSFFTVSTAGNVHSSWDGTKIENVPIPATVAAGDLVFYLAGKYHVISEASNSSAYVRKAGANAIAADMVMTWTAPATANTTIINGGDNTKSTIMNVTLDASVIDAGTYT